MILVVHWINHHCISLAVGYKHVNVLKYLWPTKKMGFNFSVPHLIFFTSLSNICWIYVALCSNEKSLVICIYFNFSLRNLLSNAQGQRRPHKVNFIKSVFILKTHENFYCPYDARLPTSDIDSVNSDVSVFEKLRFWSEFLRSVDLNTEIQ